MNKYIIPICDIQGGQVWIHTITAKTIKECQEKIMEELLERYDLEETITYQDFVDILDQNDILIGNIKDIEEL